MYYDHEKYRRIFISHSKKDINRDFFSTLLTSLGIKGSYMELENIPSPAPVSIRDAINHSDAIFVLLSKYLLEEHIGSWVSFEVGVASNCMRKELVELEALGLRDVKKITQGVEIFVFEPKEEIVNYPVVSCNYYMVYENNDKELRKIKEIMKKIQNNEPAGILSHCPQCGINFYRLNKTNKFYCPGCRVPIEV